ncbi:2Fe-2S iron-sulfur cluster-binding protein [Ampullimonas aquatilis]|uniref:2Fe-2S iron-sulfur cluster-binding protein n=1 Tax=Ampullimonas aquatilis TaxID=1341549 RepID=UPI003C7866E8
MITNLYPKVSVTVLQTAESYPCATNETLLKGMAKIGRRGIPVGCLNGGCGICKIRIVNGMTDMANQISRAHVSAEESEQGITLACCVVPKTDVQIEVVGKMTKPFLSKFVVNK